MWNLSVWLGNERQPQTQTFGKWLQARTEHLHEGDSKGPEKGQLTTWAQGGAGNKCCLCTKSTRKGEQWLPAESVQTHCFILRLWPSRTPSQAQSPQWAPHSPKAELLVTEPMHVSTPLIQCLLCRDKETLKAHPKGRALYHGKTFTCSSPLWASVSHLSHLSAGWLLILIAIFGKLDPEV